MSDKPTYLTRFARQRIKVDGNSVEVFIMGAGATLPIGVDLSEEMDRVSAQLGYWAAVHADAKAEAIKVDAHYRRFRALSEAAILDSSPSIAANKIKAKIDGLDGFIQHKDAIAAAEKNVSLTSGMVQAFDKKANALQSLGAKARAEMGAQGMTTPKRPKRGWDLSGEGSEHDDEPIKSPDDGQAIAPKATAAEREKRMAEINANKGTKGKKKPPKKKATKKAAKKRSRSNG